MAYDPQKPYNALPLLPPPVELETKAVLKQCIAANRAVAELKGAGDLIPNQAMLINVIPLQEARLSSEIENIVTTQDKLFRAAVSPGSNTDPATKEVLQYRSALRYGFDELSSRPLNTALLVDICGVLRQEEVEIRDKEPILIGNRSTGSLTYTPPRGRKVLQSKLDNLETFLLGRSELDPLVRMAVGHYQFEAIHPFVDGNGRTGRIMNILYLIEQKLLSIPVLYLSRFIIQDKKEYYDRLRAVTESSDWEGWLLYMLKGIEETAHWTTSKILAIRGLFDSTVALCREKLPRNVYSKELIELIFIQPYVKIQFVVDAGIAQRQAAADYLKRLEEIGLLRAEKAGRELVYQHPGLLKTLTN